jgi:hypothetical protein
MPVRFFQMFDAASLKLKLIEIKKIKSGPEIRPDSFLFGSETLH